MVLQYYTLSLCIVYQGVVYRVTLSLCIVYQGVVYRVTTYDVKSSMALKKNDVI
jgi:hypothetical protein